MSWLCNDSAGIIRFTFDRLKYVEVEMAKKKGVLEEYHKEQNKHGEDFLYDLPDNLKEIVGYKKRSEDMLSNQMLSGIPEVDLGIE